MNSSEHLLFIDTVANAPYGERALSADGLGGTEASVVRVAQDLARDRTVTVAQRARHWAERGRTGTAYVNYDFRHEPPKDGIGTIVVVRAHKLLPRLRRLYPRARLFLWMHCFPGRGLRSLARIASTTCTTVLGVSRHHLDVLRAFCARHDPMAASAMDLAHVYNPIDCELQPRNREHDRDKLVFLSSPHKGLEEVLGNFAWVREREPSLRLYIANPGYLERRVPRIRGVVRLGTLPHQRVIDQLRDALCLFYPQTSFAETFGLVFAEAQAVGTPVLTHDIGAAPEIIGDAEQVFDVRDRAAILERLRRWRRGERPIPHLARHFRSEAVLEVWRRTLATPYRGSPPTNCASHAPVVATVVHDY